MSRWELYTTKLKKIFLRNPGVYLFNSFGVMRLELQYGTAFPIRFSFGETATEAVFLESAFLKDFSIHDEPTLYNEKEE